jgi:hypothetical protein
MTYLEVGRQVMEMVKHEFMPMGPTNQLFANAASLGAPAKAAELVGEAESFVFDNQAGAAPDSGNIFAMYAAQHPVVSQISPAVLSPLDPQMTPLHVAAGTGACNEYAAVTAVLTAQALAKLNQPFDIKVVQLPVEMDPQTGVNAPHVFTTVQPPRAKGGTDAVALDAWTQASAPRLLEHTNYPAHRPVNFSQAPGMRIVKTHANATPRVFVVDAQAMKMKELPFSAVPTEADYRKAHGTLTTQDFEAFVRAQPESSQVLAQWHEITDDIEATFAQGGAHIANSPEKMMGADMYQQESNADEQAPTVYKTPSQRRTATTQPVQFASAASVPVQPNVQAAAQQTALTVQGQRPV